MKNKIAWFLSLVILNLLVIPPFFKVIFPAYANPDPETTAYYPTAYSLLGSTKYVSGQISDLTSDNGVYMRFRSYVSAYSPTSLSDAFIGYRSNTGSYGLRSPKNRVWDGSTWSLEYEMSTAGRPIRFIRVAYCPFSQRLFEKIVVTLSDDGGLDAYFWDSTQWLVTTNIGNVSAAKSYRAFDIEYETGGEAILVYSIPPDNNFRVAYRTWNGTSWSSENVYVIDNTVTETVYWVAMARKPTSGSEEIAVGIIGDSTSRDAWGLIWNGSSFSTSKKLTDSVSTTIMEGIAVAYEYTSGYATFCSSTGNDAFSWQWSGTTWDASATIVDLSGSSTPAWLSLKADPASDKLMLVTVDAAKDLNVALWDGSTWTINPTGFTEDKLVDTESARCADFEWEPSGSRGLLVWGTTPGKIMYQPFDGTAFGAPSEPSMGEGNRHYWIQLRRNPRNIAGDTRILGAVLEATVFNLGAISWDGSTFNIIGASTFTSDTATTAYECFEIAFQEFGDPTEFTTEVEFTGTSNTEEWSQLVWTIDSAWTAATVHVTLQLYNYALGDYPTSGNGYIAYTSTATPNIDETKTQTIFTNPSNFRNGSGNWKIKIKGAKSTTTQFDFNGDLVEFKVTWILLDITPPAWSDAGTNNTAAGKPTLFYVKWTDNVGLGGFIFGTNNTGTWLNDTWTPMTGTTNWSNVTKILNSTVDIVVQWRVWANDTSNNWNNTGILSLTTTPVGYALNLCVKDWDLVDSISGAYVYKDLDVKVSDANGWANWTGVGGTVFIKVKWHGAWVNGTFSIVVDSDKTIDVQCNIFDIVVTTIEGLQSAVLQYVNVTVYNGTSIPSNKIRTGITNSSGKVYLANVPNSTLTFTCYDGASPQHTIANVTRTISTENQAETIICDQNYITITHSWSITGTYSSLFYLGFILLPEFCLRCVRCLKERVKTIRSKQNKRRGGKKNT